MNDPRDDLLHQTAGEYVLMGDEVPMNGYGSPASPGDPVVGMRQDYQFRLAKGIFWRRVGPRRWRVFVRRDDVPAGGYINGPDGQEPISREEREALISRYTRVEGAL